jgi:hypothetical protein
MPFFEKISMDVGYLKSGWQGPTGSGKTTTAALVAIGLYRQLGLKGPVAFFDTERGSGFASLLFDLAGIEVVGKQSRSFKHLVEFMQECDKRKIEIALIDSITHPWRELLAAFKKRTGRMNIRIQDWAPIKEEWQRGFSIPYVNSPMHILMCGRQANVFEDVGDDDSGKKEWKAVKVGTKMATETETGYEANILIEMDRVMAGHEAGAWGRQATVLKDRSFSLDGATVEFTMPRTEDGTADLKSLIKQNAPYRFIWPHIEALNLGKAGPGLDKEGSEKLFDDSGRAEYARAKDEAQLLLDDVVEQLKKHWQAETAANRKARADVIEGVTRALGESMPNRDKAGVRSWEWIKKTFTPARAKNLYMIVAGLLSSKRLPQVREALELEGDDLAVQRISDISMEVIKEVLGGKGGPDDHTDLPI